MSRHELREPAGDAARLVVPVTSGCRAGWMVPEDGVARLVIDYGGVELILEAVTPAQAERLAFDLARAALDLAGYCRDQMSGRHG